MPEPHAKLIKTMDCSEKEGVLVSDRLPWEDLLPRILSFVGDGHYRFVGSVNHAFHDAYVTLFPSKKTEMSVSSKALAELCMMDCDERYVAYYKDRKFFDDDVDVYSKLDGTDTVNILLRNAAYFNFEVLQHLHSLPISANFKEAAWRRDDIFICGAQSGHFPVVQWLHEQVPEWDDCNHIINALARAGNLEILQWCDAQGGDWDEGDEWDDWVWNSAAEGGHIPVLEYLYDKGIPFHKFTCTSAAEEGHLEALQWLRSKGCPWSPETPRIAASNGHLHVVKWAYENGCPVDKNTCIFACEYKQWEVLKWAIENGLPVDREYFYFLFED